MKIPIELKPYKDELLSSWLIRSSIAHGSDPSSWVSGVWLEYRAWTRDIDRHLPKDKITKLTQITSLSTDQIEDMTLELLIEKITDSKPLNDKQGWPYVIPTGFRGGTKTNGTHFCSTCLSEPNFYFKKQWRLAWNTACPKHNQLLTLKCQNCYHVFSPHLVDYIHTKLYICTHCGYDLRNSTIVKANAEVVTFQEQLNDAAFNGRIDNSIPLVKFTVTELFATLKAILLFFRTINNSPKHNHIFDKLDIPNFKYLYSIKKDSFEALDVRDKVNLLLAVSRLFTLKLDDIKKMLQEANITYKTLAGNKSFHSQTIRYLCDNLERSSKKDVVRRTKVIKPRSKEEVEKLMDEIRPYI